VAKSATTKPKWGNCRHCRAWVDLEQHEATCPHQHDDEEGDFVDGWRCGPLKREGMYRYVHLVRAQGDPERSPRLGAKDPKSDTLAVWRRTLKKEAPESWEPRILELLADGRPRTFNEIGVTLLDKTADNLHQLPPDVALWSLVDRCEIEHTLEAPIFFRVKGSEQPRREESIKARKASKETKPAAKAEKAPEPASDPALFAERLLMGLGREKAKAFAFSRYEATRLPFWVKVTMAVISAEAGT
jgi:hypothetical protein